MDSQAIVAVLSSVAASMSGEPELRMTQNTRSAAKAAIVSATGISLARTMRKNLRLIAERRQ